MTLSFLSGSKNFCKLLWVSCEFFVLHGYAWIHWVAKSCTTIDCVSVIVSRFAMVTEDLVICCYQVTKICSSRYGFAIASSSWGPCNFGPFTDLAISVFMEMRINTVLTQILTSLEYGSTDASWEELAWESPCTGISSSTKISLNSCSHSGISELARPESANNGFPRSIGVSFLFRFVVWGFYWLGYHQVAPICHQP